VLDFDRKPSQKSADEIEFDSLCDVYKEQFGKPYVFDYAAEPMTWEEALADIRRRIADNDPQPAPDYKPGVDY
jgi:2-oxo-4-hydroxy-4-carboxy--5-ureidoimidazoline (OHCU) decarboxylase